MKQKKHKPERMLFFLIMCIPLNVMATELAITSGRTHPNEPVVLTVDVNEVNDLFAYEIHVEIVPLDGQDPNSLAFVSGSDIILGKYKPHVFPVDSNDGFGASIFNDINGIDGNDEEFAEIVLQASDSAYGLYEIGLGLESALSDNKLDPIQFTWQPGYMKVLQSDFHKDLVIDSNDFFILIGQWLSWGNDPNTYCPDADVGGDDCTVNLIELAIMALEWDEW